MYHFYNSMHLFHFIKLVDYIMLFIFNFIKFGRLNNVMTINNNSWGVPGIAVSIKCKEEVSHLSIAVVE